MSTKKPPKQSVEEILTPIKDDLSFEGITRLMGDSAANGDNTDPVVYEGESEIQMRRMTAKYGFDRLPLTYGELQGLIKYTDKLELITGRRSFPADEQAIWQQGSFRVSKRLHPEIIPAATLYAADDIAGLKALHTREDTLKVLGKKFREFDRAED